MKLKPWQTEILDAYPHTDVMKYVRSGGNGAGLARFVHEVVVASTSLTEARALLGGGRATLDALCMEIDEKLDSLSARSVETPLGEQIDGGGELSD